jgi:ribonuclease J
MNCFAVEQDDGIVVVDCGAGFPEDDVGVDVFHPDFSWLLARRDKVAGVFLTHGHEDHIGGLPYLLRELNVPVWGPPHALGLVRRRLAEHEFQPKDMDLREAHAGERYQVGPFVVEPVRVAHSIVEASALCIETRMGRIVHTGDFNLDPEPPDGEPTDEARLRALGDQGVAVLLSDSTNIDVPERAGSEVSVAEELERLIAAADARVVVALFASNVQRLISLGQIAQRTGRKVCLMGRSLDTQVGVATQIGRLHWPSDLLLSPEQARQWPRESVLLLAGGTQAEQNSALRRLSLGTHQQMSLEPGDTVILSSRVIPGNDRPVIHMINDLLRRGVKVRSRVTDPKVHTSGHAGRSEQRRMLEWVRPRCFMPVHGTLHHLLRHAELGRELGIERTLVVENGTPVVCDGRHLEPEAPVESGRVHIAMGGEPMTPQTRKDRGDLARHGVALVTLALGKRDELLGTPEVKTRGVPAVDDNPHSLRAVAAEVSRAASSYREGRGLSFEEFVRRAARRKLEDLSGTRPLLELSVVRLER